MSIAPRTLDRAHVRPHVPDFTFRAINFKSIASVELPMTRLTILAGSNSSGKSSLLQAALFLAQSIRAKACVINGDLVRLGEPKDVIRDGADELTFDFRFQQQLAGDRKTHQDITLSVSLRASTNLLKPHCLSLLVDNELIVEAVLDECPESLAELLVEREVVLRIQDPGKWDLPQDSFITAVGLEPGRLLYQASEEQIRPAFDELVHSPVSPYLLEELVIGSLRARPIGQLDEKLLNKVQQMRPSGGRSRKKNQLSDSDIDALLPLYVQSIAPEGWASEEISLPSLGASTSPFRQSLFAANRQERTPMLKAVALMGEASKRLHAFAASVVHLGPLRDDPRVAYPLGHTISNLPVGEKGEFTAAYLENNKKRNIRFHSDEQHFLLDSLLGGVTKWSRYLGIADKVGVSSLGKMGHELTLELDGCKRDPTAIGVGASQLLPVVVTVLGAAPGQLVLLEQPELHLHPKVQSRLADFFAWARPDVRLLIETHSEYLVTRIRLRVAERRLNPRSVAVLFVAKRELQANLANSQQGEIAVGSVGTYSDFRELRLDDLGDFDYWPDDFFDALERDLVGLATAVTGQLKSKSTDGSHET